MKAEETHPHESSQKDAIADIRTRYNDRLAPNQAVEPTTPTPLVNMIIILPYVVYTFANQPVARTENSSSSVPLGLEAFA